MHCSDFLVNYILIDRYDQHYDCRNTTVLRNISRNILYAIFHLPLIIDNAKVNNYTLNNRLLNIFEGKKTTLSKSTRTFNMHIQ